MCRETSPPVSKKSNISLSQSAETWPHYPIFLKSSGDTICEGYSRDCPLPIGEPFQFESSLFKGKMLLRVRNAKTDNSKKSELYFTKDRKRILQIVVQGKFKEALKMSDVYFGDIYREPLQSLPHPSVVSAAKRALEFLVPGVKIDLNSSTPKIVVLYAGCTKFFSIDKPGNEPSITEANTPENTDLLKRFPSKKKRKEVLGNPTKASMFKFDPKHIYTFHHYDDVRDLANYELNLPVIGKIDIKKVLKTQPMTINAETIDGRSVFSFDLWHKAVWNECVKRDCLM